MAKEKRFSAKHRHKLDDPRRREIQPPEPLVDLIAASHPLSILDMGAGTGYFSFPLATHLESARILALDGQAGMLEVIRQRAEDAGLSDRIVPVEAEAEQIPLAPQSVQAVLMVNLYHELSNRPAVLSEVSRVLAPGGKAWICDYLPDAPPDSGPPLEHRIPIEQATAELKSSGFVDITHHAFYPNHWVLESTAP